MRKTPASRRFLLLLLLLGLAACAAQPAPQSAAGPTRISAAPTRTPAAPIQPAPTETLPPSPTGTPSPAPSPSPTTVTVWVPGDLPEGLSARLAFPAGVALAAAEQEAGAWVTVLAEGAPATGDAPAPGDALLAEWVYVLAAPFPTVADDATLEQVRSVWDGAPAPVLPFESLVVTDATRAALQKSWGPASAHVQTVPAADLVQTLWNAQGRDWAILPFEEVEPRLKVIAVDGQSPLRKGFDPAAYPLKVRFWLQGGGASPALPDGLPVTNYDPNKLTTVLLTGVTALVRGTAALMEVNGNTFPAEYTGDILREADILHINNEVPFWKTCPVPYNWEGLVFCSRTKYIELLEDIGTDVVDLAGDHFQDWGPEAMLFTIDLYQERGWKYYGGGRNIQEAQSAARFDHNGNRIAFLGCNAKAKGYAGASETSPGAVHCDFEQLTAEIARQRVAGYLPIVTFQHLEYYSYNPHPILEADFQRVADAGAVIVSGSQAHQPHAMTFQTGPEGDPAFLHYGLGNLFFDQNIFGLETSQAFLDRHVFYDGRYIGTELVTVLFVDYARARLMTPDERAFLLTTIFKASGWEMNP